MTHKHSLPPVLVFLCLLLPCYLPILSLRLTCVFLLLHEAATSNQVQDGVPQNVCNEIIEFYVLFLQEGFSWRPLYHKSILFRNPTESRKTYFLSKCLRNLTRVTADAHICLESSWLAVHTVGGLLIMHVMLLHSHTHLCYHKFNAVVVSLLFPGLMFSKPEVVYL